VVLLVPPAAAIAGRGPGGGLMGTMIGLGIGGVWLLPVFRDVMSCGQWALCVGIVLSLAVLVEAVVRLILVVASPLTASATVTLLGLAWLTWPIWLATWLAGASLRWSVALHPLFAINHVVANLGIWTEQQVAYNLTTLGQDVSYQLPRSAWPVIGFQLGLAGLLELLGGVLKRKL
jgi:hypothetical protein